MITCSQCHERNLEGELFCTECGAQLTPNVAEQLHTAFIDTGRTRAMSLGATSPQAEAARAPSAAPTGLKPGQLALLIGGAAQALILEGRAEYVLGREGQEQVVPDVNLNAYGAREKGVSRVHAALRRDRNQVLLIDLGSTNGTRLNDRSLTAHQAVKVENGDEIRLGKLLLKISFVL
ncbi:MAG: FHA domain-containing protein [Anaerolineales bacterium]|nr:FHA domain-containing protein [Anaerolineales bacterium]